ncbi:MAG: nucleotidyltransferase family protein [Candidatus Binatia bacterium]
MIVAVILAAGESSRMGRPKALLPIEGVRFIEKIVTSLRATKVGKIVVVLGHNAGEMRERIADLQVTVLINQDYKQGQLSSLLVAIRDAESAGAGDEVEGILVHLVDHPYLSASLVDLMIDRFRESKKLIVIPRYRGRGGHPVIFSRSLFTELSATPLDQGAKALVRAYRAETLQIDTEDEGVVVDIDTPEEYRKYVDNP